MKCLLNMLLLRGNFFLKKFLFYASSPSNHNKVSHRTVLVDHHPLVTYMNSKVYVQRPIIIHFIQLLISSQLGIQKYMSWFLPAQPLNHIVKSTIYWKSLCRSQLITKNFWIVYIHVVLQVRLLRSGKLVWPLTCPLHWHVMVTYKNSWSLEFEHSRSVLTQTIK